MLSAGRYRPSDLGVVDGVCLPTEVKLVSCYPPRMETALTQVPNNLPGRIPESVTIYLETIVRLVDAQSMFGFSRTSFFRFRRAHHIASLPGGRVSLIDIVRGFEEERKIPVIPGSAPQKWTGTNLAAVFEYRSKLLALCRASEIFELPSTTFWRFRLKHSVGKLSGAHVHADDIIAGLDAERRGSRSVRCAQLN